MAPYCPGPVLLIRAGQQAYPDNRTTRTPTCRSPPVRKTVTTRSENFGVELDFQDLTDFPMLFCVLAATGPVGRRGRVDTITQAVTIAAVLLGALTTYVTNHLMERSNRRQTFRTRWDEKKLDAYADYIGRVRASIHASVLLYEVREDIRAVPRGEHDLMMDLTEAGGAQALAFERVMLLAGDDVVDASHRVQEATAAIGWQARGAVEGTLEEWRGLHTAAFGAINAFHQRARADLGVSGAFEGEQHTARGLLLPGQRSADSAEAT